MVEHDRTVHSQEVTDIMDRHFLLCQILHDVESLGAVYQEVFLSKLLLARIIIEPQVAPCLELSLERLILRYLWLCLGSR